VPNATQKHILPEQSTMQLSLIPVTRFQLPPKPDPHPAVPEFAKPVETILPISATSQFPRAFVTAQIPRPVYSTMQIPKIRPTGQTQSFSRVRSDPYPGQTSLSRFSGGDDEEDEYNRSTQQANHRTMSRGSWGTIAFEAIDAESLPAPEKAPARSRRSRQESRVSPTRIFDDIEEQKPARRPGKAGKVQTTSMEDLLDSDSIEQQAERTRRAAAEAAQAERAARSSRRSRKTVSDDQKTMAIENVFGADALPAHTGRTASRTQSASGRFSDPFSDYDDSPLPEPAPRRKKAAQQAEPYDSFSDYDEPTAPERAPRRKRAEQQTGPSDPYGGYDEPPAPERAPRKKRTAQQPGLSDPFGGSA